ncbi:MAG: class I SAM-dependent methyltransferase [Chloroflexota bacterium]
MNTPDFNTYMRRINTVFDVDAIIQRNLSLQDTEDYYLQSNLGYLLFHSWRGAVHMALSDGKTFTASDYKRQIQLIATDIRQKSAHEILELGMGKGYNLHHLAKLFDNHHFYALDYSALHARQTKRHLRAYPQVHITRADFHHIPFVSQQFDYVFGIESICHALNIKQVLQSVYRVLRTGGYFALFDGFRIIPMQDLNAQEQIARHLVEKPLGVNEGTNITEFIANAQAIGFKIVEIQDLSSNILPNLRRLQRLQTRFFPNTLALKLAHILLPHYLLGNVIASMLMPYMVEQGIQGYFKVILQAEK